MIDKDKLRARQKRYTDAHKEHRKEVGHAYYALNREAKLAYQKQYAEQHSAERAANEKARRAQKRNEVREWEHTKRIRHGITAAMRDAMAEAQEHRCAICREPKRLVRDHSHVTGEFRGLLCHSCNVQIAIFDDAVRYQAALHYLGLA